MISQTLISDIAPHCEKRFGDREESVTKTMLRDTYKMSAAWIKRLGPCDEKMPNPRYLQAAPMQLWRRSRVEMFLAEHYAEFERQRISHERRSAAGKNVAAKRARELMDWARNAEIDLYPFPRCLQGACKAHLMARGEWGVRVTDRRIVAMVRHEYTNYHDLLDSLHGQVGRWEAYPIIRARINQMVCAAIGVPCLSAITGDVEDLEWLGIRWGEQSPAE